MLKVSGCGDTETYSNLFFECFRLGVSSCPGAVRNELRHDFLYINLETQTDRSSGFRFRVGSMTYGSFLESL